MDRFWLLTTTFYGNWLPGDPRGFVSRVRDHRSDQLSGKSPRDMHNVVTSPFDQDIMGLHQSARDNLRAKPVRIDQHQADVLQKQFVQTAAFRGWRLIALAIMANHVHLVVGVSGDPDPTKILADFKAYGSRALTSRWELPASGTWWTYSGSKRKLESESNVFAAVAYLRSQEYPLVLSVDPEFTSSS